MNKKQRIINWLNIFLLVINITAFVTVLIMNDKSDTTKTISNNYFKSDSFLKDKLQLSDEQFIEIQNLDKKVFKSYQILLDAQCEDNFCLLNELSKDMPDQHKMDSIAKKIGKYHTNLKRVTIKHFMDLRRVCTDDQSDLLDQLIQDMMELDDQCKYCNKETCSRRESLVNKK